MPERITNITKDSSSNSHIPEETRPHNFKVLMVSGFYIHRTV